MTHSLTQGMILSSQGVQIPRRGFALAVTLSLMILLTAIAVGLLALSSVTLRTSTESVAIAEARANAHLALMMALGDLQTSLGPDQNGANLTCFWDFRERLAPTDARDGFEY